MTKSMMVALSLLSGLPAFAQKKILFIASAANELPLQNGETFKTGVFLSEFYPVYTTLLQAGFEIDFATPDGKKSTIDQESLKEKYWKKEKYLLPEARKFTQDNPGFNNPKTLEEALAGKDDYIGVVIPGGQGLMVDLIHDTNVSALLMHFNKKGQPIGLVCHAPALLLSIPKATSPFTGYRVNSVTRMEELVIENLVMKGKPLKRRIARQLKNHGLKHKKGLPAANFALRDRELVTSQNPYSNGAFIKCYLEALKEYVGKATFSHHTIGAAN